MVFLYISQSSSLGLRLRLASCEPVAKAYTKLRYFSFFANLLSGPYSKAVEDGGEDETDDDGCDVEAVELDGCDVEPVELPIDNEVSSSRSFGIEIVFRAIVHLIVGSAVMAC